jgi:hypothetical protein
LMALSRKFRKAAFAEHLIHASISIATQTGVAGNCHHPCRRRRRDKTRQLRRSRPYALVLM